MKEIKLSRGYKALVDDEEYERVSQFKWSAVSDPRTVYAGRNERVSGKRKGVKLHRFILNITDSDIFVDHKNHNGLDCRKENLRACTRSQNQYNSRKRSGTKNKYKGVYELPTGDWITRTLVNGVKKSLGHYKTDIEAAVVYDISARLNYGVFAHTNFQLCPITIGVR